MVILELRRNNFPTVLSAAVKAVKSGQVLICPTDTVYGLVGDFYNKKAVERIYSIKRRPKNKPLPVFVNDIKMAKGIAKIKTKQEKFLKTVWPGPVTCIFAAIEERGTVGIRMPNYRFALDLVRRVGPLVQTSANISGEPASTKISEILGQFEGKKNRPDLVINAQNLAASKPSRIIDLTVSPYKILRQ